MDKISKEVKIGLAFIIAIFILYYGINFLKGINIFKPSNSFILVFDNVEGLTQSTPVTLNGFQVGLVYSMELDPNNPSRVITYLNMDKGLKIPTGSKFSLDVSVLGSASIALEMNPYTKAYISSSDTIVGVRKKGLMDAAGGMLPQVELLLPKIDSILLGIQALVNNPALAQSLTNVNQITEDLAKTSKQFNAMAVSLNKDVPVITGNLNAMSSDLAKTTKQFNQMDFVSTFNSVDSTMKNIHYLSTKVTAKDNSLGLLLNDRELYDSINSTIGNASLLLKDVKENPQRYINIKVF
ncbi:MULTISPECIES: MlaD family protein [unclassified Dysgonomonas]|uniref:MlaD family protein n=1 Tax=unclassified Dysgonomonas TaxID=2630389 RepID=UPI0013EB4979|nr:MULTISPECIES: MlaD family protein [unclassified Dysgonomonas]